MKYTKLSIIITFSLLLLCFSREILQGADPIASQSKAGESHASIIPPFPLFNLSLPQREGEGKYLGVTGTNGHFTIDQIQTKILVIEVFNFYCPHCQRAAPEVNRLYQMMEERKDVIKMIGIGASNSDYEVNSFRDKYHIPFPLFSDSTLAITEQLGIKGTPTFIAVRIQDGLVKQFYVKEGAFTNSQQVLDEIINLSGIASGELQ